MKFEQALQAMREGKKVKRKAWENEVDNPIDYIKLDKRENSGECDTYFTHNKSTTIRGSFYFEVRVTDLLANDWEIVGEEQPEQKTAPLYNCVVEQLQQQIKELQDEVNLLKWRLAFIAQTKRSDNSEI